MRRCRRSPSNQWLPSKTKNEIICQYDSDIHRKHQGYDRWDGTKQRRRIHTLSAAMKGAQAVWHASGIEVISVCRDTNVSGERRTASA
jgi:hypothetical protein